MIRHVSKSKVDVGLKTIEEKDKQFLIEKLIQSVQKEKPYKRATKKKQIIMSELKRNYRICRRVYQSLFIDAADTFIQYIHMLDPDETEQMEMTLKQLTCGLNLLLRFKMLLSFCAHFRCFTITMEDCP